METNQQLTVGEQRVRKDFNPNGHTLVKSVKDEMAAMIDFVESQKHRDPRLAAIAQTKLEEAAMWMVKLVTA